MKRKTLLHKLLPLALCAAIMATSAGAVTPPADVEKGAGETDAVKANPTTVQVWGAIEKLENGSVRITNDSTEGISDSILHVFEDTLILDAVDGTPISLDDVKDGDLVYAYISPVMTRSMPPQSTAMLLLGNIPADFRVPAYYQVTDFGMISTMMTENNIITATAQTDQGITLTFSLTDKLDKEGNLHYIQKDGVVFTPYVTKNIVTVQDLIPGSRILVWSDYEGKTMKVMVFPYAYAGYLKVLGTGAIMIDGQGIQEDAYTHADGICYLPLRAVAEAVGFTVTWNQAGQTVTVSKGDRVAFTYTAGADSIMVGGDGGVQVTPSITQHGSMYLTATELTRLLDVYLVQ